jgi:hypothetical protein
MQFDQASQGFSSTQLSVFSGQFKIDPVIRSKHTVERPGFRGSNQPAPGPSKTDKPTKNGPTGLHSSEYQTRQRRAGCEPVSKDLELIGKLRYFYADKHLEYAFFEVPIPSK